jgi:Tfp pilus assembly protein PilN
MSAHQKDSGINLLPEKGFATSTSGRILAWVLSTFRIIVIVTEIIVMLAFVSRFWLDAQNKDLDDLLKNRQEQLELHLPFERDFKDVQERLKIYKATLNSNVGLSQHLKQVADYMPPDVFLIKLGYKDSGLTIEGFSPNERSIQQYLVNLQAIEELEEVTLVKLSTDPKMSNLIIFEAKATVRKII